MDEWMQEWREKRSSTRTLCLACLYVEAAAERGWSRRGVWGWRFHDEVSVLTGRRIPEYLPYLALGGRLDRIDVRADGSRRPVWMYRISTAGVRALGEKWEAAPKLPPEPLEHDPEEGSLYIPAHAWKALEVLRTQVGDDAVRRFGTPGWMSALEIHAVRGTTVSGDLSWLLQHRLAERRTCPTPEHGRRPAHLYRITELGLRTEFVGAAPVGRDPALRVQVRLRDPRA